MTHYDLVVIGAGSGNTVVDDRFGGWRVAIVEPGPFGGTCLSRGCIPSKMLVAAADAALGARRGDRLDLVTTYDGVDWPALRNRIFGVVDDGAAEGREHREGQDGVDVLTGTARFTGDRTLRIDLAEGGTVEVSADHVVLATGSRPVVPDIPGLDEVEVHTSDTVMRIAELPPRIGVVGGGYVGVEQAHVFSSLGAQVVQVDESPTLLGTHDADVARVVTADLSRRWDVRLEAPLERVARTDDGAIRMHLGDGTTADVDVLLLAIGRRPNGDTLDLERGGVKADDTGRVLVDEHQRSTSAPGVWSLGDASSPEPLKHVANQDARVVRHNLLHPDDLRVSDHRFVPHAVFITPQVAAVGLTEEQARDEGIDVAVAAQEYGETAHGWALREDGTGHLVKLLADRATGRLVGAHLVGPQASVLVQPLIQAMSFGQPVAGLARGQYWVHPSLTEVVEQALLALEDELAR